MRIAICDDNKLDAKRIEWALLDLGKDMDITYYPSGHDLLDEMAKREEREQFDVIFLDIYMPGENGIDVADRIKEISPSTDIIFSTSSKDHAIEAFRVQAIDYLVKPYEEIDIVKAFARVSVSRNDAAKTPVLLNTGGELRLFQPDDVVQIESDGHYTRLVSADGNEEQVRMVFSEVTERFKEGFVTVKRGLMIRMDRIETIVGDEIHMYNGTVFTMSRSNKEEIIRRYTDYMESKE